jgi:acyl carrier protein
LLSDHAELPRVRLIHLSGAPITRVDFELFKRKFVPGTLLWIGMGSTEARGICSAIVDHSFPFPEEGCPVGYPAVGKKILLLDESGHEVGPGEVGEIAVKGRNLNPGYWRKPVLTSAKFLPDSSGGNERIYLTGDLGRMLPDGFLIYLGRKDFMVKIRGYRVEPTEVENMLLNHTQVKEVGVVAWDREPEEKYLTAYIVPRRVVAPKINELSNFLRQQLPDYMIPSNFVFLKSLPFTNGKLDRAALPRPDHKRPDLGQPYTAPHSEVEQKLVEIWEELLDVRPIGIHDNFFDLGGHSLAATRVVSQVIKRFQLELPLQSLFKAPTVAAMAAIIAQHQGKKLREEELDRILAELETLSDEDAKRLLADQSRTTDLKDSNE